MCSPQRQLFWPTWHVLSLKVLPRDIARKGPIAPEGIHLVVTGCLLHLPQTSKCHPTPKNDQCLCESKRGVVRRISLEKIFGKTIDTVHIVLAKGMLSRDMAL